MLIDSHCHLTDKKLAEEIDQVIERANEAGVEIMICPTSSLRDALTINDLVSKYKNVYGLVGVHPEGVEKIKDKQVLIDKLKRLILNNDKIVGIGEIGLDTYWNKRNLEKQEEIFRAQLDLALELEKPVSIHNRLAEIEMRDVFDSYKELPVGVIHCFSGSNEWLEYVLDRGFYVSFAGNLTYKSANDLRELAKKVPLERLLVETDAPYLSPEGRRGQRNEPANVKITAEFLASLLGMSLNEIGEITTQNAKRLFKLK